MTVLDDYRLELGEGPGYDPVSGLAWWFDIVGRRLYTRAEAGRGCGGATQVAGLPLAASAMAITEDGARQLLLAENGLYLRDPVSGALDLHLPLEADNPATRSGSPAASAARRAGLPPPIKIMSGLTRKASPKSSIKVTMPASVQSFWPKRENCIERHPID